MKNLKRGISYIRGDVLKPGPWQQEIPKYDIVINLSGESIFRRWTANGKRIIYDSRVVTARNITDVILSTQGKVRHFFSVSGVGYYGYHGNEVLGENAGSGSDFLAGVAERWEAAALRVKEGGVQSVICRLGHVLGSNGGVFPKFRTLAMLHLAGYWARGEQWISWIHIDDLINA